MSIHIFSFDENQPSVDQQIARLQKSLIGLVFSNPLDIHNIADFLFVRRYDISITLVGYKVSEITMSKTRSKYEYGSITIVEAS